MVEPSGLGMMCMGLYSVNLVSKGGRGELFTCQYPLKVQALPLRDQRPALWARVSGQEEEGLRIQAKKSENKEEGGNLEFRIATLATVSN